MLKVFSERLRWQMKKLGLQANELAARLGVEPSAVSNWVNGENMAKGKNLRNLAGQLQCSIEWLTGQETGEPAALMTRDEPNHLTLEQWMHRAILAEERLALVLDQLEDLQVRLNFKPDGAPGSKKPVSSRLSPVEAGILGKVVETAPEKPKV